MSDELLSQISPQAGRVQGRSYATVAEESALAIFQAGMSWAATLIGGSEFPGVPDKGADIIARYIRAEAVNLGQIPHIQLKPEDSP